jgi:hypothetical protein
VSRLKYPPPRVGYSKVQYHCLPITLIKIPGTIAPSMEYNKASEGTNIKNNKNVGTNVHINSILVL